MEAQRRVRQTAIRMLAQEYRLDWAFPWARKQALEFIVILSKKGRPGKYTQ